MRKMFNWKAAILAILIVTPIMAVGFSRTLVQAQGQKYFFTLHLVCPYVGPGPEHDTAMQVKDDLAKIGINVEVHFMEKSEYYPRVWGLSYNKTWDEGGWDIEMGRFGWDSTDAMWSIGCYHSTGMPPNGWNYFGWNDGIADRALELGWKTVNYTERLKYYETLFWELYRNPPHMSWYHPRIPMVVNKRFDIVGSAVNMGLSPEDGEKFPNTIAYCYGIFAPWWKLDPLPDGRRVLRMACPAEPHSLLGMFMSSGDDWNFGLTDCLVTFGIDPETHKTIFIPWLAKSWEFSEDGKTVTFYLREDACWQDGVPITADDVVWQVNTILDPETASPMYGDYAGTIESVEALNETTVVFHLKEPTPDFLALVAGPWGGALAPKHILEDVPHDELMTHWMNTEGPTAEHPDYVGSGPFKFVEWKKGEYLRFVAWDGWWGWKAFGDGTPTVDEILIKIIPDESVAISALEAGEVDLLHWYIYMAVAAELPSIAESHPDTLKLYRYTYCATRFLGFNLFHPILNNRFVRLAICHAINVSRIVNDILKGEAIIASGGAIWPPFHALYPKNPPPPWEYNIELAKQYMEMAGYKYEYLTAPEAAPTPITVYVYSIVGGLVVGVIVGFVAGRLTKREQ